MSETTKAGVAPYDLLVKDFTSLAEKEKLSTTEEIEALILIQSVEGRAHEGSGLFHKRRFPNTTIDDVVKALDREPRRIKSKRQKLIDEIEEYVKQTLRGDSNRELINSKGQPLLRIPELKNIKVDSTQVLRGIYLGGLRDDIEVREKVEEIYQIPIGGGKCHLVNTEVMEQMGLDGDILAHQEHKDKIQEYRRIGLIVDSKEEDDNNIIYTYIRYEEGPGQSDDAAIVVAGLLFNLSVALGVFLADAIDTLEKYSLKYADQDMDLARYIEAEANFKEILSPDDLYRLTYLSSIPESSEEEVPDSSLRYLLSVDSKTGQSILGSHLAFLQHRPFIPMPMGKSRSLTSEFYDYISKRVSKFTKAKKITPELITKALSLPVAEVMSRSCTIVGPSTSVKEALECMLTNRSEALIVTDGNGKPIGIVKASDLLKLFKEW